MVSFTLNYTCQGVDITYNALMRIAAAGGLWDMLSKKSILSLESFFGVG